MIESHATSTESRQIRVFLSSTFVDFMEERERLVKRVFPTLNRRARDRGVELIDVDLRWGVTEEQTKQGLTLPLCLGEIDRCRPYFIGLLGERHGWVPPAGFYQPGLLEREPWLKQLQGGASVTELEILHGVLRNPEMAGYARFYLRDPAYALAKKDPTWLAEGEEERQRLQALKEQVRASRFPVVEGLPDPEAIASRIEADLWDLIEERFPEQEQPDALEQENRKHASYRHSRTSEGQYIGGESYIQQLEHWLEESPQQILITGESGSGKSALIANWMQHHRQEHPSDVVYAHHLGCSNDSNAIQPLLGRMLDTASKLLKDAELITEPIQVPEDWWQLTAKVTETLLNLGRWCRNTGHRWIWVLDGLDRLTIEDQQALPWLPLFIPEGVSVMISALECPARAIVQERQFEQMEIGPLQRKEQEQLIETYLERYTKKLDLNRLEQILACDLASSPLFLRVLLEELRQCGRFETLEAQIAAYIGPKADGSLAVNDLYARVLARLEGDCGTEPVRKALTALWASRAGLSETELLNITGLAQLQWAPIDLALHKAFGHNGNRLVFDHDYLRIAVQDRYLSCEEARRKAHSDLANWFGGKEDWDSRKAEELPWQLQNAGQLADLREILLDIGNLYGMAKKRAHREVVNYWRAARADDDGYLDELVAEKLEQEICKRLASPEELIEFLAYMSALFEAFGFYRNSLLRLRYLSLETVFRLCLKENRSGSPGIKRVADSLECLSLFEDSGRFYEHFDNEIQSLSLQEKSELLLASPSLFSALLCLAATFSHTGSYGKAKILYSNLSEVAETDLTEGLTDDQKFDLILEQAILELKQYDAENKSVGDSDQPFLNRAETLLNKAVCYAKNLPMGVNLRILKANQLSLGIAVRGYGMGKLNDVTARLTIDQWVACLGPNHPDTIEAEWLFAEVLWSEAQAKDWDSDDFETPRPEWVQSFLPIYKKYETLYGENHPISISRMFDYANHCRIARLTEESLNGIRIAYCNSLLLLSQDHPTVSRVRRRYAYLLGDQGDHEASIDMLEKEYLIAKKKRKRSGRIPSPCLSA
jgi:hypothetical protein